MLRGVERHGEEKLVKRVYWVVVEARRIRSEKQGTSVQRRIC